MLKMKFFVASFCCYLVSLAILLLASLESFTFPPGQQRYSMLNLSLILFLLLTLFFIAANVLCITFFEKIKRQFDHKATVDDYEEKIESNNQRLEALLHPLQEGVLIVDEDLRILHWNRKAEQHLGMKLKTDDNSLLNLMGDVAESIVETCCALTHKALEAGCILRDSVSIVGKGTRHIEVVASPIISKRRVILILNDTSKDHQIAEMGKDFVANASHELRTPVTIIEGFAETLRDLPTVSESMLEDITEKIIRSCHRMNALVKNLLMLADLDNSRKLSLKPCDLVSLTESCSYSLLSIYPEACVETLQNQDEILIDGDPDLLEQAIMNLLLNAVKYSQNPAHITVTIRKEGPRVTLEVEDQGIGIDEEHLNEIFSRFYRVNKDRSRKLGGTGLGLSIVHSIIEKHQGGIEVSSKKGVGTCFKMTFLASDLALEEDGRTTHPHHSLSSASSWSK